MKIINNKDKKFQEMNNNNVGMQLIRILMTSGRYQLEFEEEVISTLYL